MSFSKIDRSVQQVTFFFKGNASGLANWLHVKASHVPPLEFTVSLVSEHPFCFETSHFQILSRRAAPQCWKGKILIEEKLDEVGVGRALLGREQFVQLVDKPGGGTTVCLR